MINEDRLHCTFRSTGHKRMHTPYKGTLNNEHSSQGHHTAHVKKILWEKCMASNSDLKGP